MKYPGVKVNQRGLAGLNLRDKAFALVGRVSYALRKDGVSQAEIDAFITQATHGDDEEIALHICAATVDVS